MIINTYSAFHTDRDITIGSNGWHSLPNKLPLGTPKMSISYIIKETNILDEYKVQTLSRFLANLVMHYHHCQTFGSSISRTPKHPWPATLPLGHPQLAYRDNKFSRSHWWKTNIKLMIMMKNKQRRKTRYVLEIDLIVTICICKLSCFCQVIQITPANLKDNGVLFERKCQESVLNIGKKKLRAT